MPLDISWFERAFDGLLQTSWQASILVGLILVAQIVFRKGLSPAWRYGLWLLVVVRLVLPGSIESAVSVFNLTRLPARPGVAMRVSTEVDHEIPAVRPAGKSASPLAGSPAPTRVAERVPTGASGWSVRQSMVWAWLAVMMLLFTRVIYKNYRFSSPVVRRRPVTDKAVLDLLQDCKMEMKVHVPMDVIETDKVDTPALLGLVRPRLLLPPHMLDAFARDKLRYFFLHELSHFKRGDNLVNWAMSILQVLHWFNPLVWLAFSRMRADRETACDAHVLAHCGHSRERRVYGEAILDVAEFAARPHWLPGVVGILEDKKQIARRITMIANYREYPAWTKALAVSLLCALGVLTLTDARSQQPALRPAQPDAAAAAPPSTGQVGMSGQLVLIDSSAVAGIEQKLGMDLDPASGRTLLTEAEAVGLVEALQKDGSAHLVGEGSAEMNSGETTVIKSIQDIAFGGSDQEIRQIGWIHQGTVTRVAADRVLATFNPEWCELLGMKKVHGMPMPLFQSLNCAMSYRAPPGYYVLLRGRRAPLKNFHGVTFAESLGAQLKDRSLDYFLLLSAGFEGSTANHPGSVADQAVVSCRFFSLGPDAQDVLQQSTGIRMLGSPVSLTAPAYGELLDRLNKMTDVQILSSGSVVTSSKQKAQTQWVQEVIFWNGQQYQTRKCGPIFEVTPMIHHDQTEMDLSVSVEFTFPPEHPDSADGFSPQAISTVRSMKMPMGQTVLASLSAPSGILPPRYRCFIAVTARRLGDETNVPGSYGMVSGH